MTVAARYVVAVAARPIRGTTVTERSSIFSLLAFRASAPTSPIVYAPASDKLEPAMSSLSPRLQVRVQQKQTLTPGLVQMVSLLQLNRLELKEMISAEVAQNPVLEEGLEGGEELTPEELQPLLEAEAERTGEPADKSILEATTGPARSPPKWMPPSLRPNLAAAESRAGR